MKQWRTASAVLIVLAANLVAADSEPQAEAPKSQPVKSTFLITGLHCPPCTSTVEKSLKSIKGVRSVKVDWATKNAKVEFDEQEISSQQLSSRIAATPHMMGGQMKYGGWLALKVPEIGGDGIADRTKAALMRVKGVSAVSLYVPQKSIGVSFSGTGNITSTELIETLKAAGIEASAIQ